MYIDSPTENIEPKVYLNRLGHSEVLNKFLGG